MFLKNTWLPKAYVQNFEFAFEYLHENETFRERVFGPYMAIYKQIATTSSSTV